MTNPINPPVNPLGRSTTGAISSNSEKPAAKNDAGNSTSNTVASDDTVSLSSKSQQVAGLQQQLKDSPVVDQIKVDAIKQEIANGNYPLDAQKIAENLINLEQSLIE